MALPKSIVVTQCPTCERDWQSIKVMSRLQAAKEPGMMRLTEWVQPGERMVLNYQYPHPVTDHVFAGDWLTAEAARVIRSSGRRAVLAVKLKTGEQALYVDRVAGDSRDEDDDEDDED